MIEFCFLPDGSIATSSPASQTPPPPNANMDQESNQMEQQSVQCRNGCGFYGNAASEGYCSVCYKDIIKKKQQPPTNMPASLAPAPGQMAGLSIDEAKVVGAPSLLATASPTVIVPPSQNEVSIRSVMV